ncbi:MAG: formate dehydrogenase accessory protein FdhE [Candidatus Korarchaeum sp.]|nr:formate dehydrogenase accessory protein FdhE [Candidatus Korarchaeum sp.]MDW8035848.1 formate dehydrogenase accessory protein FdhE [Candidatus Korarchaeum sp.]
MDLRRVERSVHKMIEEEPELSNSMLLFLEIFTTQVRMYEILAKYVIVDDLVRCFNRARSSESSLFDTCDIPKIDSQVWKELTSSILYALAFRRDDLKEEVSAINNSLEEGLFDPESLAKLSFRGDLNYARGVSLTLGVSEDLLSALGVWVMQSIFMAIREILDEKAYPKGWDKGFCPICGSYTKTSFTDGEGVYLKCEICGMEWDHPKNKCPFCGSSEVESSPIGGGFYALRCSECGENWHLIDEGILGKDIPRELYPMLILIKG